MTSILAYLCLSALLFGPSWRLPLVSASTFHRGSNRAVVAFATPNTNGSAADTTAGNAKKNPPSLGAPICDYHQVDVPTSQEGPPTQKISVEDLTPTLNELLATSGMKHGVITVISRHTTTAITINERESRLTRDLQDTFLKLVPADERSHPAVATAGIRYQHNDIDQRPESEEEAQRCRENGWDIDNKQELQKWREQEPINVRVLELLC